MASLNFFHSGGRSAPACRLKDWHVLCVSFGEMKKAGCLRNLLRAVFAVGLFLAAALTGACRKELEGTASWYSQSDPGVRRHTANGEVFRDSEKTCASWDFEFGTLLQVTNRENGRSVTCRVNDRGPAKRLGRLIDLSRSAFQEIAPLKKGLIRVVIAPPGLKI